MQTGIVASVAEMLCESEKIIPFVILLGVISLDVKLVKISTKIGHINKSPKVEKRDNNNAIFPNPNGLKNSIIIAAAPRELRGSGFLKIKFPITIIT